MELGCKEMDVLIVWSLYCVALVNGDPDFFLSGSIKYKIFFSLWDASHDLFGYRQEVLL